MPPDLIPFHDISAAATVGLFLVYFLSFFIRGTLGFGSAMPAVLGSAWILPPHEAVIIALLTSVFAQVQLLPQGFRDTNWKVTWPMIAGMLLTIVVGVGIFASLKDASLTVVLGVCICFAVVADMTKLTQRLARRIDLDRFSVAFWISAFAGFLAGVAGAGSNYFLSFYVRAVAPSPIAFRATNIVVSGAMSLWRAVAVLFTGLITLPLVFESALIMPVVYAGGWAGRKLVGRISPERYFRLFQILLLAAAAGLIWKGIAALA